MMRLTTTLHWKTLVGKLSIVVAATLSHQANPLQAQDFRVDTEIFVRGNDQPVQISRTLFLKNPSGGDIFYDFVLGDTPMTTIFDLDGQRILLISPQRRVKSEISMLLVSEFAMAIREKAPVSQQSLFDPQFRVSQEAESLVMTSPAITYEVKLQTPKLESASIRYKLLADWASRLNLLRAENVPSFGRQKVNDQVLRNRQVPLTVRRKGKQLLEVWSKHAYIWALARGDRERISVSQEQLATFSPISIKEFFASPASRQAAK